MQCDVQTLSGVHCPGNPVNWVKIRGHWVHLCSKCYRNYLDGAYTSTSPLPHQDSDKIDKESEE